MPCASSRSSLTAAASSSTASPSACVGLDEPALRGAELHQQRDQALLRAVVEIALEPPASVVGRREDARPRSPHLGLVPLPVGDVGAADEVDGAARDSRQRRARPGDLELGAVPLQPLALVLGGRLSADRRLDAVPRGGALAVRHVPLPEERAARLVGLVAERALERLVRRVRPNAAFVVDEADQARRVVRDRVQQVALALELVDALPEARGRLRTPCRARSRHHAGGRSSYRGSPSSGNGSHGAA